MKEGERKKKKKFPHTKLAALGTLAPSTREFPLAAEAFSQQSQETLKIEKGRKKKKEVRVFSILVTESKTVRGKSQYK